MRDLWATIGACCIDADVRTPIKNELEKASPDFGTIQRLLRKHCGLNLSRWEMQELQRLYSEKDDALELTVLQMIENVGHFMPMAVAPEDRDFCAAIGLACIDQTYRDALHGACAKANPDRTADLVELLQENEACPRFKGLCQPDLQRLNRLMALGKKTGGKNPQYQKEVKEWMKAVQDTGWESPKGGGSATYPACSVGYSLGTGEFLHVSQPKLAEVLPVQITVAGRTMTLQDFLVEKKVLS